MHLIGFTDDCLGEKPYSEVHFPIGKSNEDFKDSPD